MFTVAEGNRQGRPMVTPLTSSTLLAKRCAVMRFPSARSLLTLVALARQMKDLKVRATHSKRASYIPFKFTILQATPAITPQKGYKEHLNNRKWERDYLLTKCSSSSFFADKCEAFVAQPIRGSHQNSVHSKWNLSKPKWLRSRKQVKTVI